MITLVFIFVNALIVREIVVLLKIEDESVLTSSALSIWIGAVLLLMSFLADIRIVGWIMAALMNLFFIFLYKKYYSLEWKDSILLWEAWITAILYLSIFIAALFSSTGTLLLWGLIPLLINLVFVFMMRKNTQHHWVNITTVTLGFLFINVAWLTLFKWYAPF
ncbi:hypothetical protein J4464_00955 [Candidatus Woesearchaeota archaeon]|nr:hypothetical protein [Candidatus Woesearchaeota archaeon]